MIVEEVPVGDVTTCGEVSALANFQLFRVQFNDLDTYPTPVWVRQEPLPPGEQGDFFAIYSADNPQNFQSITIETEYASTPVNMVARAALFAQLLQN